jgi:glycosyltransferase involved in cell wall biosynthesis
MNTTTANNYSVVTFAYNEEDTIGATIRSIIENSDHRLAQITIVANGCTDRTYEVALATLQEFASCRYVVKNLAYGDKCNAWNFYVHQLLPDTDVHFFVDSDVTFTYKAFAVLFDGLIATDKLAIAGLPLTGRNIDFYTELTLKYACLYGGLYGLRHEFLNKLRSQNIKLPIGLSWIDAQLTKMINHNLEPAKDDYQGRVTCIPGVGYEFDSLKPWKLADIRLYINRLVRYKSGQLQEVYLDELPFTEWPEDMQTINEKILAKGLGWAELGKLILLKSRIIQRLRKKRTVTNTYEEIIR